MDENEFVTKNESVVRNPKSPTGLVDDISVSELSPRPGLPPVSELSPRPGLPPVLELLPGSSIESKVPLKGFLREHEFDPEEAAEMLLNVRKIDFQFERPVKLSEREKFNDEMDYINVDEFLSRKEIKKNEDESDFGKAMSPTGPPQWLLSLVPDRDLMEELCLKFIGDDLDFKIVDDISVTELSPCTSLPPLSKLSPRSSLLPGSSIESKVTLKGFLREHEFDPEEAAEMLLNVRKTDFQFERPVKLSEKEKFDDELDYINADELLSRKKIKKNEDESDFGKPMLPDQWLLSLDTEMDLLREIDKMDELCHKWIGDDRIVDDISETKLTPRTSLPCKVGQHESPVKKVVQMDYAESHMKAF